MAEVPLIRVGVGLGSNLGDRGETIARACEFLGTCGDSLLRSSLYESDPVDCPPGSPTFLNAAVELSFAGDLGELLVRCQEFEREQGRPSVHGRNMPRTVDLDLLYAGDAVSNDPGLTLPHPRLHERAFVLMPLLEICPERVIPLWNRSVRDLWLELEQAGERQVCQKIA